MDIRQSKESFEDTLQRIAELSDRQISAAAFAVMKRYGELFPEEEIVFLSLPKDDPAERRGILERVCALEHMK